MTESAVSFLRFMAKACVITAVVGVIYCLIFLGSRWGEDPAITIANQIKLWLELVITPIIAAIAFAVMNVGDSVRKSD